MCLCSDALSRSPLRTCTVVYPIHLDGQHHQLKRSQTEDSQENQSPSKDTLGAVDNTKQETTQKVKIRVNTF